MVRHGTYTLDAPPPFQGVWRVAVDRVHYRFNLVRMYLLGCGDCHEVYLRHLPGDEYVFHRCYYHRGDYDGFCQFASTRYVFDDHRMHATRLPPVPEVVGRIKPDSLVIPLSASPEPMATLDMPEVVVTIKAVSTESMSSIATDELSDLSHAACVDVEPDTVPKSPFSDSFTPLPRITDDDIDPFPFPTTPSVHITRAHTPTDLPPQLSQRPTPAPTPDPHALALLHATSSEATALAGAVATLRTSLMALETQLVGATERTHALEGTVARQAAAITGLTQELESEREKVTRLRGQRGQLLLHRSRMFEAFGLDDPEKWEDD